MAASSETLTSTDKASTRRTAKLTPGQALEILQSAAQQCQQAGLSVRLTPIYDGGVRMVAVVLSGVELADGMLVTADTGKGAE